MNVLYLVHDLADSAVRKRIKMLKAGNAIVSVAGFVREQSSGAVDIEGCQPIVLGTTRDGKFGDRVLKVLFSRSVTQLHNQKYDVIIARNLEMLALARRVTFSSRSATRIVYECLDIHRIMLNQGTLGKFARAVERWLLRSTSMLITSSPAYLTNYFKPKQQLTKPVLLVENKVLDLEQNDATAVTERNSSAAPAWRIGWFGILRCRKSLAILSAFSRMMDGKVQVVLRGKPAYQEFDNFDAEVAAEPYLSFEGAYKSPEDLKSIYEDVDFIWAIDFFEEGLNSSWLLPNRIYEGCRYGRVPIAVNGTETANFLKNSAIGLTVKEATPEVLRDIFSQITPLDADKLKQRVQQSDPRKFTFTKASCSSLVDEISKERTGSAQITILE